MYLYDTGDDGKTNAAAFYTHNLKLGDDVNATTGAVAKQYASNDYRLAKSTTSTLGLKYGVPIGKDSEISVRGEFITQAINNDGVPAGEETPDLDALVLQLNYSLVWWLIPVIYSAGLYRW